jgi:hypothetical protein
MINAWIQRAAKSKTLLVNAYKGGAILLMLFYSWRGFNTLRLCRGYKGIKPESNTTRE